MHPPKCWRIPSLFAAAFCLIFPASLLAAEDLALTKEQMEHFLQTAKVIKGVQSSKGVTSPWRLTLTDGTITHDASFQAIDEHKPAVQLQSGTEINFVDSYKLNIAAYRLAELLGLDDLLPVYVERKYQGNPGSVSWWLPVQMDEVERHKRKLSPPDPDEWNRQMYRVRVFDELVYDTDPNLTNVLIGENWKIWRVDFTRAFRLSKDLKDPNDLVQCDRKLLEKLKALDANQLAERTKGYLSKDQIKALMARRDKIVACFTSLIANKGEGDVLY